ncbi:antitoxin Xre/MbcA/ParS-like domain-containing protein [Roseovarius sp. C03]|uniref:antitoxin Xre/MbcA/ParS-like domain-containing protein n=1 Tax=Roseovarius sp. C03 TaxID=3449222 RepID=UPI003EDC17BA
MSSQSKKVASKAVLTQAIERKLQRLDVSSLRKLAADLNVKVPPELLAGGNTRKVAKVAPSVAPDQVWEGERIEPVVSAREGMRMLDAIAVDDESADWVDSELLGAGELAKRLSISRGTLDNWRNSNKIIAFRKGLRNFVYPARQFAHLRPAEGIEAIIEAFPTAEDAWDWLVTPNRSLAEKPPIDALHDGKTDDVLRAVEGTLDFA